MKFVSEHSPDGVCFRAFARWILLPSIRQMEFASEHSPDGDCFRAFARYFVLEHSPDGVCFRAFARGSLLPSVATIFGPPAQQLVWAPALAKGLRRLLLLGGPLAGPFSPAGSRYCKFAGDE